MKEDVTLLRAIGAEFIGRKLRQVLVVAGVVLLVLMLCAAWLVHYSVWWLLFWVPLIFLLIFWIITSLAGRAVLRVLRPEQTKVQKLAIRSFVDKLSLTAERVQTPVPFIVMKIFWDVFVTKKRTYLPNLISETASLRDDYAELRKKFSDVG